MAASSILDRATRHRRSAIRLGTQLLAFAAIATLLVVAASEPSAGSVLLFGSVTVGYSLASFALDRPVR